MMKTIRSLLYIWLLLLVPLGRAASLSAADGNSPTTLLIRCDDVGMCHAVNLALKEVIGTGLPFSTSVMFACPWYQEAVEILKEHPNVSVGVHLTLTAEWKSYRWGPVAGRSAVPSLVDSEGYFFPSGELLLAHNLNLAEAERELRSQIERALHSGLKIDYLDYHMGTPVSTPELRAIVMRLAREYKLGISRYFGEKDMESWYGVPIATKKDTLLHLVRSIENGSTRLLVFHIGRQTPEMDALVDLNAFGLPEVSRHREGELRALTSPEFRAVLTEQGIRLVTYRDLIREVGLDRMRAPTD